MPLRAERPTVWQRFGSARLRMQHERQAIALRELPVTLSLVYRALPRRRFKSPAPECVLWLPNPGTASRPNCSIWAICMFAALAALMSPKGFSWMICQTKASRSCGKTLLSFSGPRQMLDKHCSHQILEYQQLLSVKGRAKGRAVNGRNINCITGISFLR